MHIGVLSNPQAGRNRVRTAQLRALLDNQPDVVHIETSPDVRIEDAVATLARRDIDVLAVCGGDGTLQQVLTQTLSTHVFARLPFIAPLKGGRTNTGALDIGSQSAPVNALSTLLKAAREGGLEQRIVERPVLCIDLGPDESVQYGFFFGLGVIHRATDLKHRILPEQYFQGALTSGAIIGLVAMRALFGSSSGVLTRDHMDIQLDSQQVESQSFLLVFATTLNSVMNLRPFWGQEEASIHFTAVAEGAERLLLAPIRIVQGRPPRPDKPAEGYLSRNVSQLDVQLDCGLFIDGELFAPKPGRVVRIEADQRLRFVNTGTV
jgi:diacylglycerol kinase (ATP)